MSVGIERAPYFRYWGKARPGSDAGAHYHLLPYHCLDVAAVGLAYLQRTSHLLKHISCQLRLESRDRLLSALAFSLALHDLGKFSEAFQSQRPDLFRALRGREPDPAKPYVVRHDSLGMWFWSSVLHSKFADEKWLGTESADMADGLDFWLGAVTGHHGQPPKPDIGDHWERHFHPREDKVAILTFVEQLRGLWFLEGGQILPLSLTPREFYRVSQELSWWLAGVAVLADWLGSNTDFFPYRANFENPTPLAEYWTHAQQRAAKALDAAGVLPSSVKKGLRFSNLFPDISVPSPLQEWSAKVEIASGPQIHMLEDVTGAGKTEAALMLAYRLMSAGEADGFFIGLPTMATANAMYGRIAEVYQALFAANASLALAHGNRNLVEAFAASVVPSGTEEGDDRQADDTATARCTAWLADHNKRALLAPAGVGTLDQALLAVLHSRHQSLRLLGLFRKVLIVDEVHACDAYMQGVLQTLLEFHARAGGSAILLSATLTRRMKQSLLDAFAKGLALASPKLQESAYPLATTWCAAQPEAPVEQPLPARAAVCRQLAVHQAENEIAVIEKIFSELAQGRCVCWIRNTVADAMAAYEQCRGRSPDERLTLFHARFALRDRLDIEERVLGSFGPASQPEGRRGRLLIATQVVEQSLDVDFDFVVSDLAPVDRLLQRAGRMCRHTRDTQGKPLGSRSARDGRGTPCFWVFGPTWADEPESTWFKQALPKAAVVYQHHGQLWHTARVLRAGRVTMPEDARSLIEGVFSADVPIPFGMQRNANVAEARGYAEASLAQQNTLKLGGGYTRGGMDWWSEAKTPSRLGEATVQVLLARWDGDQLRPWAQGKHGWAYSSLRVSERLVSRAAEPGSAARKAAYEQAMQEVPGKGAWSVILPLESTSQGWVGRAWASGGERKPERLIEWLYDSAMGLRPLPQDKDEEEAE